VYHVRVGAMMKAHRKEVGRRVPGGEDQRLQQVAVVVETLPHGEAGVDVRDGEEPDVLDRVLANKRCRQATAGAVALTCAKVVGCPAWQQLVRTGWMLERDCTLTNSMHRSDRRTKKVSRDGTKATSTTSGAFVSVPPPLATQVKEEQEGEWKAWLRCRWVFNRLEQSVVPGGGGRLASAAGQAGAQQVLAGAFEERGGLRVLQVDVELPARRHHHRLPRRGTHRGGKEKEVNEKTTTLCRVRDGP